jgi:transcriptional regulator with XRE-family HTH domain
LVGTKIRELRKKLGLTQEQLAGTELTKSYVSQVELGRISPSQKALQIIAARLGKPVGYFQENRDDLRTIDFLLKAARALWTTNRLEEGMLGLKEALILAERTGREELMAQIRLAMARLEMAQGHDEAAREHLEISLKLSRNEDHAELLVEVADTLGLVATRLGRFQEAVHSFQVALDAASRLGPEAAAVRVEALRDYGDFCHGLRQWPSALDLYRQALDLATDLPGEMQAELFTRVANTLAHQGAPSAASENLAQALQRLPSRLETLSQAIVSADVGKTLLLLHRPAEAYQRLTESLDALRVSGTGPELLEPVVEALFTAAAMARRRDWVDSLRARLEPDLMGSCSSATKTRWQLLRAFCQRSQPGSDAPIPNPSGAPDPKGSDWMRVAGSLHALEAVAGPQGREMLDEVWHWVLDCAFSPEAAATFLPRPTLSLLKPIRLAEVY